MYMYAYKQGTQGGKALIHALDGKMIRHEKSHFIGHPAKTVINWGSVYLPAQVAACRIINRNVSACVDKLAFFTDMKDTGLCPAFTTSKEEAQAWADNRTVVCRTLLSASGGRGIVLAKSPDQVVPAPLYTRYVPKDKEYRIHFFKWEDAYFAQRKALRRDEHRPAQPNWAVRNHANGFIYAHEGVETPDNVIDAARVTINTMKLDFGAVDVLYTKNKRAVVLEVNTAPGLEGWTLEGYTRAFKELPA